ncbi:MAG: hypothetical protein KC609_18605, partial [Myxococcales bacterium]|nr:hypothetical protein [Myxococcales bacterium]
VFGADGVDADLSQSKHYQLLSLERLKKTGLLDKSVQPGAPKIPACHQLIQLAPVLLACLRTTSKQVKPKQYRYTLIYNPIALLRSQPLPPVTLLDGPDHPEQFVVDPSLDRLLVVVDQRQHGHRRALLVYTVPRVF